MNAGAPSLHAEILVAANVVHSSLDERIGVHHHALPVAVRRASSAGLISKELAKRCFRLARAADALRHTTEWSIKQLVAEVRSLGTKFEVVEDCEDVCISPPPSCSSASSGIVPPGIDMLLNRIRDIDVKIDTATAGLCLLANREIDSGTLCKVSDASVSPLAATFSVFDLNNDLQDRAMQTENAIYDDRITESTAVQTDAYDLMDDPSVMDVVQRLVAEQVAKEAAGQMSMLEERLDACTQMLRVPAGTSPPASSTSRNAKLLAPRRKKR